MRMLNLDLYRDLQLVLTNGAKQKEEKEKKEQTLPC